MNQTKNSYRLPLYIGIALAFGVIIGSKMPANAPTGFEAQRTFAKLKQVLGYIESDYVDEVNTAELVDKAIVKMLDELDPHSVYISAEELKLTEGALKGNFEGIGVEFSIFKDTITVISPLSGGPSEKLGIRAGDKIIKVDGNTVAGTGITNRDVLTMLRGTKGSKVTVEILRKGVADLLLFEIKRDVIPQFSVDVAYMIDPLTGYIKISRFSATTYKEFKAAMTQLQSEGMQQLILDLTGNPGGYLDKAVEITDEFLPDDKMIVYTKGKETKYEDQHLSSRKGSFETGKLIVLIDEGSASASEIVAGALQDHDRALIVGRRSFGKGLVQRPIQLADGSEMRLTISRYYTPSGRSIQRPYINGQDEYNKELFDRFENGEIFDAEMIKLNDTTTYQTASGRIVYGGGGIMPDVFVSLDTVGNTSYLRRLFTTNAMMEYSMEYSNKNRERLLSMGKSKFFTDFQVTEEQINGLIRHASQNGLSPNQKEIAASKSLIQIYLKAYIARGIWDNDGFYPIFNQQNEIYTTALDLFEQAGQLSSN